MNLTELVEQAAEQISRVKARIVLSVYYYVQHEREKARNELQDLLKGGSLDDRQWVLNILGIIERDSMDYNLLSDYHYDLAISYYNQILLTKKEEGNFNFSDPLYDWAYILSQQARILNRPHLLRRERKAFRKLFNCAQMTAMPIPSGGTHC